MLLTRRAAAATAASSVLSAALVLPALAKPYLLHPEAFPDPEPVAPVAPPAPVKVVAQPAPPPLPTWRRHAVPVNMTDPRPKIAIVIDDMGAVHPHTERMIAMPGPLTLSWFPFAPNLAEQVPAGAARGHEAMLHMPMQSFSNSTAQTGPNPLRVDLPADVNLARLRAAMDIVPQTVGLNNHMGCVATRDAALMDLVAKETLDRGMLFLDSVTIAHSVALKRAELAGVPAAARDIFIDHVATPSVIEAQLATIEAFARHYGYAIAIGHPRPHTCDALEAWLPTLAAKGFVLWPMSAAVAFRNKMNLTTLA